MTPRDGRTSRTILGAPRRRPLHAALRPYREAADVIDAPHLDDTILRPAWLLCDAVEIDCGTMRKGEAFS
ncbi:MAG: hypothetical protein U0166_07955 [Acidobacteriota bacterium]